MKYLAYLYFAVLVLFSFFIFSNWTFMLFVWLILIVIFEKKAATMPQSYRKTFAIVVYLYPLIASIIKFMVVNNTIPYSWFWLNRLEHLTWSFSMTVILCPLVYQAIKLIKSKYLFILLACITIVLGNIIEIIEFCLRQNMSDTYMGLYYGDTMLDIIMNFTGSIIAAIFLYFSLKKKSTT